MKLDLVIALKKAMQITRSEVSKTKKKITRSTPLEEKVECVGDEPIAGPAR